MTILATQYAHEQDGFGGHTYDEGALYENGDGTYSDGSGLYVRVDGEYIPVTADASVSGWYTDEEGTNYVAGADAVKAVFASAEDGENITFIDDVSISSIGTDTYITAERVTIDLNNHTVSVDYGTDGNSFSVTGDGSVVKNGTFKCIGSRTDYPLWITGNIGSANVVVENVTVEGGMQVTGTVHAALKDVTISANNYYDVYLAQNSRVTVESGSFSLSVVSTRGDASKSISRNLGRLFLKITACPSCSASRVTLEKFWLASVIETTAFVLMVIVLTSVSIIPKNRRKSTNMIGVVLGVNCLWRLPHRAGGDQNGNVVLPLRLR